MTAKKLPSPAQQKSLMDLQEFIFNNGFSPTVKEMAAIAGITNNAACERIDALIRKGYVTRRPGAARSLIPVDFAAKNAIDLRPGESLEALRIKADRYDYLRERGVVMAGEQGIVSNQMLDHKTDSELANRSHAAY
jgi:SOS-response transcriptional repressor LexA